VSACHMLWFLSLAQERGFVVSSYRDEAEGEMGRVAPGRMGITRILLRPKVVYEGRAPDSEQESDLHEQAHERCFIASSLRAVIVVEGWTLTGPTRAGSRNRLSRPRDPRGAGGRRRRGEATALRPIGPA